ncbi:MAG: tetratricopeptide repeat protein [Acidiferrobacter sp.]
MDGEQDQEEKETQKSVKRAQEALESGVPGTVALLEELAGAGSSFAMVVLGWAYETGTGVVTDTVRAEAWYQHAWDADDAEGALHLGQIYMARRDYARGDAILAAGAARGLTACAELLSQWRNKQQEIHEYETVHAILARQKVDPEAIVAELQILAEGGSVRAMVALAHTYQHGTGVSADCRNAEIWYRRAYEQGKGKVKKSAARYLAQFYLDEKDYANAIPQFEVAAKLGSVSALRMLARMHKKGWGCKQDPYAAMALLEQAVAQGNVLAGRDLAILLMSGRCGWRRIAAGFVLYARNFKAAMDICYENPEDERLRP